MIHGAGNDSLVGQFSALMFVIPPGGGIAIRPLGQTPFCAGIAMSFSRPFGMRPKFRPPGSELPGYFRMSLRDKNSAPNPSIKDLDGSKLCHDPGHPDSTQNQLPHY